VAPIAWNLGATYAYFSSVFEEELEKAGRQVRAVPQLMAAIPSGAAPGLERDGSANANASCLADGLSTGLYPRSPTYDYRGRANDLRRDHLRPKVSSGSTMTSTSLGDQKPWSSRSMVLMAPIKKGRL